MLYTSLALAREPVAAALASEKQHTQIAGRLRAAQAPGIAIPL